MTTHADETASEAVYEVRLTVDSTAMPRLRELMVEKLEAAQYPDTDAKGAPCAMPKGGDHDDDDDRLRGDESGHG